MHEYFDIDLLLLNCLQGNADENEYEIAYNWVTSSKINQDHYKQLRDSWLVAGIVTNKGAYNINEAWLRVERKVGLNGKRGVKLETSWRYIAAALVFAFISGAVVRHLFYTQEKPTERENHIQAPLGAKSFLILPDSTKVWLNAGSTLKYSTNYDITGRGVFLTGEAYFEVKQRKNFPFRVNASGLVIQALGTEFNVKAYPGENQVETTLVSGLVSLEHTSPNGKVEKTLLKPNQRAFFTNEHANGADKDPYEDPVNNRSASQPTDKILIEPVKATEIYTSWKDKRFVFESEPMAELAVKLERIYNVKITFMDEDLKSYRLSGSLELETLEQLLEAIQLTIPMDFQIKNNIVQLSLNRALKEKYESSP